jgi:large-conductance mechanosensitive channel
MLRRSLAAAKGDPDVIKGFKDFIMRGNLVELAVAFMMATAFGAVVTCLVPRRLLDYREH